MAKGSDTSLNVVAVEALGRAGGSGTGTGEGAKVAASLSQLQRGLGILLLGLTACSSTPDGKVPDSQAPQGTVKISKPKQPPLQPVQMKQASSHPGSVTITYNGGKKSPGDTKTEIKKITKIEITINVDGQPSVHATCDKAKPGVKIPTHGVRDEEVRNGVVIKSIDRSTITESYSCGSTLGAISVFETTNKGGKIKNDCKPVLFSTIKGPNDLGVRVQSACKNGQNTTAMVTCNGPVHQESLWKSTCNGNLYGDEK